MGELNEELMAADGSAWLMAGSDDVCFRQVDFDFLRFSRASCVRSGHDRLIHGGTEDGKTMVRKAT